jgi:cell division protein DivIC
MAVSKQKVKKKKRLSSMSGAMLAITFVVMLLLLALVISGFCLQKKITSNNSRMEELQEQIASEKQRTEEIEEEEQYMQSDEYLEQTAKEKLGFVKDGEIIFKENK